MPDNNQNDNVLEKIIKNFKKELSVPEDQRELPSSSPDVLLPNVPIVPLIDQSLAGWYSYFLEKSISLYDFFVWLYKAINKLIYIPEVAPTDPEQFKLYQQNKREQEKREQLQTILDDRRARVKQLHNEDLNIINRRKNVCSEWYTDTKTELNKKLKYEQNLYVTEKDRSDPTRLPGWNREQFDHRHHANELCNKLYCKTGDSSLPPLPASPSNKNHNHDIQVRDLKRQLEQCDVEKTNMIKGYDHYVATLNSEVMDKDVIISKIQQKQFALPDVMFGPAAAAAAPPPVEYDLGFWNFLLFPIDVARGKVFSLAKGQSFVFAPFLRFFELLLACLICVFYMGVFAGISHAIRSAFDFTKESAHHWAERRREAAKYRIEEERRDKRLELRRRGRREFGQTINRALDGPLKKAANLVETVKRGGALALTLVPPISEIKNFTFTEMEKEQILLAHDPIFMLIRIEKNRLEMRKIIQTYNIIKRLKGDEIVGQFNSVIKSVLSKRPSGASVRASISTILGALTLVAAATQIYTTEPTFNSTQYVPQTLIERNVSQKVEMIQEHKVEMIQEIEEVEEILEMEIENKKTEIAEQLQKKRKNRRRYKEVSLSDLPAWEGKDGDRDGGDAQYDSNVYRRPEQPIRTN